jgi:RNA polymerase sigma factor (TIGR02999 family)
MTTEVRSPFGERTRNPVSRTEPGLCWSRRSGGCALTWANVKSPQNTTSVDETVALAYQELRAIAHLRLMARGPAGTLSTTALVHEAYLKLVDQSPGGMRDRAHLLALASLAMRHVLIDRARERSTVKRGGERRRITLDEAELSIDEEPEVLLQLNDALDRLAAFEPRLARVVECRFFGGLTELETADALGLTVRTVQRDWVKARVLLRRALES